MLNLDANKTNRHAIAFIGFGEVGQRFARDLLRNPAVRITAYDILFGQASGKPLENSARELGVLTARSAMDACKSADVIISAVTASQAEIVAQGAGHYLTAGQILLDINSAAPSTKQRSALHVEKAGAHYVEGAVMAAVLKPGISVQILAGGPHAAKTAEIMNALGMNLTPVALEHGKASAMKLCRSIMIKGLEALMVDCTAACEIYDVKEPVFTSLIETFPSIDWYALSENMRERVAQHGVRRSAEMREAGEMLQAAGLIPDLANAVAEAQLRGSKRKAL